MALSFRDIEELWRIINQLEGEQEDAALETPSYKFDDPQDLKRNVHGPIQDLAIHKKVWRDVGDGQRVARRSGITAPDIQYLRLLIQGKLATSLEAYPETPEARGILHQVDEYLEPHYLQPRVLTNRDRIRSIPWFVLAFVSAAVGLVSLISGTLWLLAVSMGVFTGAWFTGMAISDSVKAHVREANASQTSHVALTEEVQPPFPSGHTSSSPFVLKHQTLITFFGLLADFIGLVGFVILLVRLLGGD